MFLELAEVFFRNVCAIHLPELSIHSQSVDRNGVALVQFGFKCGNVLIFHIGIRIHFTAGGGIQRLTVAIDKILMGSVILIFVNPHRKSSFPSATQAQPDSSSYCPQPKALASA